MLNLSGYAVSLNTRKSVVMIIIFSILASNTYPITRVLGTVSDTHAIVPNYLWADYSGGYGIVDGGITEFVASETAAKGFLLVNSSMNFWLSIDSSSTTGGVITSADLFSGANLISPEGTSIYQLNFTDVNQKAYVTLEPTYTSWLFTTAYTIISLVPGGSTLDDDKMLKIINTIKSIDSIQKISIELSSIDSMSSLPGHLWTILKEVRNFVSDETQIDIVISALRSVGITISKDVLKKIFVVENIYDKLKLIAHNIVYMIVVKGTPTIIVNAANYSEPPPIIPPPVDSPDGHIQPVINHATYINTEFPPNDTVVAANQSIHKTWRVKNTGNRIWGPDHKLVFIGGNQMGAPNEVNIPVTEPGGVADISIDVTAPSTSGTHRGEWRLRNRHGTFFGDKLWVQIVVPETNNPAPPNGLTMQLTCTNCPSTVAPGQSFRPTVRVSGSVSLLQSRGDMLRNTDGNRYGAYEFVAVNGAVNQGQSYDFTFYEQNPITAPNTEGVYESKWRIWQNGGWVGSEYTIRFEVKAGAGVNHPPNTPTLTDPRDWAVYNGNSGITLQAQHNGDPNGDAITHYYFEIFESAQTPNSGWITGNSWSPAWLGNYGFQWRVKVRDARGAESGWSEVRHFNINDPTPQIQSFTWTWCHEPWGPADKVCFCAKTTGGGLELKLNSANDGSDRGAWKVIGHGDTNLNCDNDNDRPPNWGQLEAEAGSYRVRLYARPKGEGGWPAAATADVVVSLPANQRPGSPSGIAPAYDEYVNTKTVKLDWQQTYRTTNYRLQVSLDPNFGTALVDTHLPADVSEYTYTFADEYATVYWQVLATGPYGTHDSGRRQFHIDLTPPSSSIHVLPAVTTDTKFNVNWGGSDARVGLRWYHVQVRDGNRSDSQWSDWFVNTSKNGELFAGQTGHTYYFRVRAMDQVGNWEEWPAGDGDTYTTVNPAAAPPTAWWNNAYTYKRNLIIRNNDGDAMPAHYPMRLHFDDTTNPTAAELYNGSLAPTKGDDLRIVYTNQTEIDRFVQRFTPNAIDLWFPLQAGLGGSESNHDGYQLYYGNASAGSPPSTINTIFLPETDNNTLGLWHFQEGSGGTVYDSSGRSHHGALSNGSWMDGYLGNAVSFNGANTTLTLGNHSDFNNGGAITLEAWIYPTRRSWGMVFMKGIDGNGHYRLNLNGDGNIEFVITTQGGERSILGSTNLQANQWYHRLYSDLTKGCQG